MKIRVAALQCGAGDDVAANLATCLRLIDEAAQHQPNVMVLPEFCNHCAWYRDHEHAYEVAVALDGDFLAAIAAKAKEHHCYLKLNCTVRRDEGKITGTNLLYDPDGKLIAACDKQVLMGNENNFLTKAAEIAPVIELPFGKVGMYACMEGVVPESTRSLTVRGAQLLLNSLNSFAEDEASLHIPVRAAENRVFVVASNKVGALIPAAMIELVAQRIKVPADRLHGAGESQILAPDGTVLAKAPRTGEAVIFADIDLSEADNKQRPDGTNIIANRRPELYRAIAEQPRERNYQAGAARIEAAVFQPQASGEAALAEAADAVRTAANTGCQLIVLPELFCFAEGKVDDAQTATKLSQQAIASLTEALQQAANDCVVVTSLVAAQQHIGVLLGRAGMLLQQPQLHRSERHAAWATTRGNELHTIDLPFGRLAIIVGDDALYPELFRVAAIHNVEVVAAPLQIVEAWELTTGLLERAAENRISIVAASRPSPAGASALITNSEDFTLWTEWKQRPFDGNINYPLVTRATAEPGLTRATIYPANAGNRLISQQTDLVDGRAWWLAAPLVN
jgi:predicted amidohydrolase